MRNLLRFQLFKPVAAAMVALVFSLLLLLIPAAVKSDAASVLARKTMVQESQAEEPQALSNQSETSAVDVENSEYSDSIKHELKSANANRFNNLESLLNIAANGIEIWGVSSIGNLFFAAIGAFVLKRPKLGGILIALCPVLLFVGLATPGAINVIAVSARDTQMDAAMGVMAVFSILFFIVLFMGEGFTPALIAARRDHPYKWVIFSMTFIAWAIPFGWPALFTWSIAKGKTSESESASV